MSEVERLRLMRLLLQNLCSRWEKERMSEIEVSTIRALVGNR